MSTVKAVNFQHPSSTAANLTLAADGTVTGGLPAGGRNLLYNGAMQVAQRGTSTTGITSGSTYHTADRFYTFVGTAGTWTQDIQNDAPSGSGLVRSVRMLCTTGYGSPAAGTEVGFSQRLEGQDLQRIAKGTASAQQLTLSFWVKANTTGTYVVELRDQDNTRHICKTYSISASATWEKKTMTFDADTTGALDNDNAASLNLIWWLAAGSTFTSGPLATSWASTSNANRAAGQTNVAAATNNYWQVTGVQLEVGPVASAFEFKPYGQELRECQRYYQRVTPGVVTAPLAFGANFSTTQSRIAVHFPVQMRIAPTALETTGTANQYAVAQAGIGSTTCSAAPALTSATQSLITLTGQVASGLTANLPSALNTDTTNGVNAYLGWSAEL